LNIDESLLEQAFHVLEEAFKERRKA